VLVALAGLRLVLGLFQVTTLCFLLTLPLAAVVEAVVQVE
jgi:hypothetical protein